MARDRVTNGLPLILAMSLVFLALLGFLWADGARREALEAKQLATQQIAERDERDACKLDLQAKYDAALLSFLVALSSGEGNVEVARVDAQLAMQQWLDAAGRCATG